MFITCHEDEVMISLYMSGKIVCADNSSPTQQQLDNCMWIVLTSPYDWNHHFVCFPKGSHSEEEEYLFAGIAAILVHTLRSNVHETEIEPGICNIIHYPSFIATMLVSQVRIADTKVSYATRITDIEEEVFEGWLQYIPSHRTLTSKERHFDVNPSKLSKRWQIGLGAATKTVKAATQRMLKLAIFPISIQYKVDCMFEQPHIKGTILTDTMVGWYKSLDRNRYAQVFANDSSA